MADSRGQRQRCGQVGAAGEKLGIRFQFKRRRGERERETAICTEEFSPTMKQRLIRRLRKGRSSKPQEDGEGKVPEKVRTAEILPLLVAILSGPEAKFSIQHKLLQVAFLLRNFRN